MKFLRILVSVQNAVPVEIAQHAKQSLFGILVANGHIDGPNAQKEG
jgi:hypothetical protein